METAGKRVLIVDDSLTIRMALKELLETVDFHVLLAEGGCQCLDVLEQEKPDLILLDLLMPDLNGWEVCRRLKNDPRFAGIPVLFLSSLEDAEQKVKAFEAGGVDYITKPFESKEVIARVKTHLTINFLKRQLQKANETLEEKVRIRTEALKKNEEKYQDLYNNAPDLFISVDTKTARIIECNHTLVKATGYAKEELIGRSIFAMYAPGCVEYVKTVVFPQFVKTGIIEGEELQILRKDGSIIDVLLNSSAVRDEQGDIICSRSIWRDITERKKAERAYKKAQDFIANIIDSMPSIMVGVDPDCKVTQWNIEAVRATGVPVEDAMGQPLAKAFPRLAVEMGRVREAMQTREVRFDPRQPRKKGEENSYEDLTIYPLVVNGVEGAVIRIDDVTEKVRMEEAMIQSEKMLSVGGMASGMAHEINNPIAGMIQSANVVANRLSGSINIPANLKAAEAAGTTMEAIHDFMEARGIPRMITTIIESGQRVAAIVENMLSFARKSDVRVSSHLLSELLDKILELATIDYDLKKHYDFKMIEIRKEYDDKLPSVLCDGAKIQLVLLNILRNGAHAMQEAGVENPHFIIRTRFEKSREMACMEIEDNGPGMNEATRKRVFEPFFTTKPLGMGTGLGLSVSYFIITENHGGEMAVESRHGFGAKFIIRLPLEGVKQR